MPPMPSGSAAGAQTRTTFDKLKMGALLGGSVGLIMGFIFGGVTILRYGGGPNGPMRLLRQYMLSSAATFGFFMSIGSVIRTEGVSSQSMEAYMRATRRYPIVIQSLDEKREAS